MSEETGTDGDCRLDCHPGNREPFQPECPPNQIGSRCLVHRKNRYLTRAAIPKTSRTPTRSQTRPMQG